MPTSVSITKSTVAQNNAADGSAASEIAAHAATADHPIASQQAKGMMAAADKAKLDGIQPGATAAGSAASEIAAHAATTDHPIASQQAKGMMTAADKAKLDGIQPGATASGSAASEIAAHAATTDHPIASQSVKGMMAAADKAKLDGIQPGATAYSSAAGEIADHAATVDHPIASQSVKGMMAAADKAKLDGIQSGATVNATNAELRDRTTHTGTQAINTVSGLQTALDSREPLLVAGKRVFDSSAEPTQRSRGDIWRERDSNGDLVNRWFWNGSYWLSIQTFSKEASFSNTGVASFNYDFPANYNIYLLDFKANFFLGATHNGTNYWSFVLSRVGSSTVAISTIISSTASPSTWFTVTQFLNTFLDIGVTGAKAFRLSTVRDMGTPTNLTGSMSFTYRLVRI